MQGFVINLKSRKMIILSGLTALVLLLSIGTVVYGNVLLKSPVIYENVYVNDVNIGGMSTDDAKKVLENKYIGFADDKKISLAYQDLSQDIDLSTLNVEPKIEDAVNKAYEYARSGNNMDRIRKIMQAHFAKIVLPLEIALDDKRLNDDILNFSSQIDNKEKMFEIDETHQLLKIDAAKTNKLIDVAKTSEVFIDNIKNASFGKVEPAFVSTSDPKKKADLLYNRIAREPLDATVSVKNGVVTYINEQNGIEFDKEELGKHLASEKGEFSLKITLTKPQITVAKLKTNSFSDTLAAFTTNYDASIAGRTQNVRTAAQKMNQYIIPPGGEFSFNRVVGRRSVETGFAMGKIFVGDEVIDDVGGGICQVSSTLYTAVLKANLNVLERHNHKFAVTYAPKGQDATVSYGALDFRFSNNTKYPIKVVSGADGGKMTVRLLGTQTNPGQTVEILNITKSTSTFATREKANPDSKVTKQVVQQGGMNGATVDSYKIMKQNGAEVSRTFLHTSVYVPMDRIILIPQSEAQNLPVEEPQEQDVPVQTPASSSEPVATPKPTESVIDTPVATIPPNPQPSPTASAGATVGNQ